MISTNENDDNSSSESVTSESVSFAASSPDSLVSTTENDEKSSSESVSFAVSFPEQQIPLHFPLKAVFFYFFLVCRFRFRIDHWNCCWQSCLRWFDHCAGHFSSKKKCKFFLLLKKVDFFPFRTNLVQREWIANTGGCKRPYGTAFWAKGRLWTIARLLVEPVHSCTGRTTGLCPRTRRSI